jgi:hypothetical protein
MVYKWPRVYSELEILFVCVHGGVYLTQPLPRIFSHSLTRPTLLTPLLHNNNTKRLYSEDGSDYQLITQSPISAGSTVIYTPSDIVLSSNSVVNEFGSSLQQAESVLVQIDQGTQARLPLFRLMVKILSEYDAGTNSPWYPWLASLPKQFYNGVSMTDACYDCLPPYAGWLVSVYILLVIISPPRLTLPKTHIHTHTPLSLTPVQTNNNFHLPHRLSLLRQVMNVSIIVILLLHYVRDMSHYHRRYYMTKWSLSGHIM